MFNFENLDEKTRAFMLEAIVEAERSGNIYYSKRFNDEGRNQWLGLLKQATKDHNEHWLAYELQANWLMKDFENAAKPLGGYTIKHVPHTRAETMAEGQFNRFYILGLCKRAKAEGISHLQVYRAKQRSDPRPESEALVGTQISIADIEAQLRDIQASFKSQLTQANSGISLRIPR